MPLPNFEYPRGRSDKTSPAGFGPIASFWSPRLELQGTYDDKWKISRFPLPPADWDSRSLLCAPADQQTPSHLRGGELVELENLTPQGKLIFALPKVHLWFQTTLDGFAEDHQGWVSTVIIEPDHPRVIMVWQSTLAVRNDIDYLEETVVRVKTHFR
jgi:hypothetical protein